jgi:hypothetical protein
MTESAVLAAAAAAVGIWLAFVLPGLVLDSGLFEPLTWSVGVRSSEAGGRLALDATPDLWILALTVAMMTLTCFACGLAPALHATSRSVPDMLKDQSRRSLGRLPLRAALLTAQVAISLVLLVAASLLVRAIKDASARDLGFAVDGITVVAFEAPASYDVGRVRAFSQEVVRQVDALPGAGGRHHFATPFAGRDRGRVRLPGQEPAQAASIGIIAVSPGYSTSCGCPLLPDAACNRPMRAAMDRDQ